MQMNKAAVKAAIAGAFLIATGGMALAAPATATTNVNVRSGPGSSYGAVDVLQRGQRVDVTGCRGGWCYVEKSGPDGWVSASYLNSGRRGAGPVVNFRLDFGTPPRFEAPRRPGPDRGWDRNDRRGRDRDGWDRHDRDRHDRDRRDWR